MHVNSYGRTSQSNLVLRALRRRDDGWVLIVEELVRVTSGHYKPQRTWVRGNDKIGRVASKHCSPQLASSIQRALGGSHPCYRVVGDQLERWEPGSTGMSRVVRPKDFDRLVKKCNAMEYRLAELESTLKRLAHDAMRRPASPGSPASSSGVGAKGTSAGDAAPPPHGGSGHVEGGGPSAAKTGSSDAKPRVPIASSASESFEDESGAAASPGASEARTNTGDDSPEDAGAPKAANADEGVAEGSASSGAAEAEAAAGVALLAPPDTDPALVFPEASLYGKGLAELLDAEVQIELEEATLDYTSSRHFFTELIDDEDNVLGALVVDLIALVHQGGTLIMLGEDILAELVETKETNEDLVEGMKEILNVQSRCFNDTAGNPHLRVRGFREVNEDDAWLRGSMHRASFKDGFGGRTWMLSK